MSSPIFYYTAIGAALATHAAFQIREYEPATALIWASLTNAALLWYLKDSLSIIQAALLQFQLNLVYLGTLFLSIGIYRRFFHRCRRFPGPFWPSVTKFWACQTLFKGEYHRTVRGLHHKYGDFVRVGPREIDICNVDAIQTIFGGSTRCRKGPFYEGSLVGHTERWLQNETAEMHVWKRRIWDAGFNSKSLREYEPHVLHYVDELITELRRHGTNVVDVGLYMSFFTFDIMGDLGFGVSFDMLKNGKEHDYMTIVQGFAKFGGMISTIPWCATLFAWLPRAKAADDLFSFAQERVKERLPHGKNRSDVFSKLLEEDRVTKQKYNNTDLVLESFMLTIAGSDTTSSSLATICYFLVAHPKAYAKVKAEIDAHSGPLEHVYLSKFAYLNAVIREALRLMPPIGSGFLHRETPPEGIVVDGTHIPGNTTVGIGAFELQRDPRYYGQPDDFIPERWLGEGPLPFDRNAFMAFSFGPYSCVGKHLAYLELCDVIAAMVRNFDMSFAPGYDPSTYERSIKDSVISSRAHLPMVLKARF